MADDKKDEDPKKDEDKKDEKKDDKGGEKKDKAQKEPDALFKLDAKVLLAKLHLAAAEQIRGQCEIVKNTAILNEKEDDSPTKKSDSVFDLKSGPKYSVSVFLKVKCTPSYHTIDEEYQQTVIKAQKLEGDKAKEISEKLQKENDERAKAVGTELDKVKATALKLLQTYFKHFAGDAAARKVSKDVIVTRPWSNVDFKQVKGTGKDLDQPDPKDIKQILQPSLEKFKEEAKTKTEKLAEDPVEMMYCFTVGYTTSFGK